MGQRKRTSEHDEQADGRGGIVGWAIALAVVLGLFAAVGVAVVKILNPGGGASDECTAKGADGTEVRLDPEQAANASTIAAVANARALPQGERAMTIAIATSLQESKLFNITYGDRDSLGLFQQRPSQGWGTAEQITDPSYAAGKFYEALVKVKDWPTLPLTEAAQKVQRSAFPEAYARHEPRAAAFAGALSGRVPAGMTCTLTGKPGVATAAPIRDALTDDFKGALTTQSIGEDTPGTVTVRPGATDRGWVVAEWALAHAKTLGIREIAYDGKVWSRSDGGDGWTTAQSKGGKSAAPDPGTVRIRYAD
ncbi:hypothetical protein [Yinghuangia seranimata]|uniref:hypothetical protein n=1 Tax=Yinghuangia seranimata TaxID=408067 RepID=UPI00248AB05E|nr:hypothetical protein [Yinghuangia seranimata]MDI2128937.1 hypothetical protein [Yinghuangia seranimata]